MHLTTVCLCLMLIMWYGSVIISLSVLTVSHTTASSSSQLIVSSQLMLQPTVFVSESPSSTVGSTSSTVSLSPSRTSTMLMSESPSTVGSTSSIASLSPSRTSTMLMSESPSSTVGSTSSTASLSPSRTSTMLMSGSPSTVGSTFSTVPMSPTVGSMSPSSTPSSGITTYVDCVHLIWAQSHNMMLL